MATVPLSGTNITFMSGVPFSNDYKHTRWFDNISDQRIYFNSRTVVHSMTQARPSYIQNVGGRSFLAVDQSVDQLYGTNYVMFQNADYNGKWFYAFVTKLEYQQRNSTFVYLELDVLQTWMFDYTFKPSFVVREHCSLWNTDGTPVLNTVPEDLNYGTEYNVVSAEQYRPYDDLYFMVVVTKKSIDSNIYVNSVNGYPQPFCTYIHPFRLDGSCPSTNLSLASTDIVGVVMNAIYTEDTTVNNIVSMYITDMLPDFPTYDGTTINFDTSKYEKIQIGTGAVSTIHVKSMPNYQEFLYSAGGKYDAYTSVDESKLWMYPYTLLELTDFKGNKVTYKNEYITGTNLTISIRGSLGLSNKTVYGVRDYLTADLSDYNQRTMVSLDTSLMDNNPNDVPILTDNLAAFIQGNRNSLQNQKNHIIFNAVSDTVSGVAGIATGVALDNPMIAAGSFASAAKGLGNEIFQMQALQAKQQDISNVPPSLAKQGSNTNFDYGNGYNGLWIIKKQIKQEYRDKLSSFFNMFGYKLNDVKIPNFHTRQNWNYVQTKSCNITGNFNHEDLQELKSIFDHGITLWHTDDIGNYDLANGVI
jgi:hypothetical protein